MSAQPRITFDSDKGNSDNIDSLPIDQSQVNHQEIQIMDTLFKRNKTLMDTIFTEAKDVVIVGLLFLIFMIPQVDELIKKVVPSANNSEYILMVGKMGIFMLSYFILKNIYLARKN